MIELEGEAPRRRVRKLTQVSRALTSATTLDQVLTLTVTEAALLLDGTSAALLLYDDAGQLQLRATHAVADSIIRDADADASLEELLSVVLGPAFANRAVVVPLIVSGKVMGALAVIRGAGAIPEDEEEWLLSALADQAMVALEKERLEAIRGRTEHSALVARVGYRLLGQHDVAGLFDEVSAAIRATLGVDVVGVFGFDPDGGFALLGGAGWPTPSTAPPTTTTPPTPTWEARALQVKVPISFGADDADERAASDGCRRDPRVTSGLVVAIEPVHKNRVIAVYTHAARDFSGEERDVLALLATLLSSALEREAAETERRRAAAMRDDLLAIVSHDLRNPLFAITTAASLLADANGTDDAATLAHWVAVIGRNARRMATMIKDLLDFEALRGAGLSVDVGEHELGPVFGEIVDMLQPQAKAKAVHLSALPCDGVKGFFDRDRTLQVLSNLVGNAVKFTAEDGTITLGAEVVDGELRAFVRDTGAGIPAEHAAHVFERYWQAQRTDRRGIGLGLPIAKGLVEAQGGRLWLESEPGRGTTFFFTVRTSPRPAV